MTPSAFGPTTGQPFVADAAERGSAMVWALFFVSLTAGVLVAHSIEMSANRKTMDTRWKRVDLAQSIAESGLTDATSFLRRQPNQPVTAFAPQRNLGADPPVDETLDPTIGLVREFEVNGSLWGRYEVRTDEAIDVSSDHGAAPGSVWDVGARGYLFERLDASKPFDKKPNRLLSTQTVRTEIRGLQIYMPSMSAVVMHDARTLDMLSNGLIDGNGGPALTYDRDAIKGAILGLTAAVLGSPSSLPLDNLTLDLKSVFGLREDQMRSMSDLVVTSPRQLQGRRIQDQSVFVPGSLELEDGQPGLRGRMLLAVTGDFYAYENNDSDFSGVLWVGGSAVLEGPFRFSGTMIVAGQLKVGGSSDQVSLRSDPGIVTTLQNTLSQYRTSSEIRPSSPSGAFVPVTDWRKNW
ncbi:MAG: hypothetical protein ABL997_16995 [Planctomycetota bacterium]